MKILVPVRYPLNTNSRRTIERALEMDGDVVILHVNLYQRNERVKRRDLKSAVEREFGRIDASYVVRRGFVVEESILEEAASSDVDVVVLGKTRLGKLRRAIRRLVGNDPQIEEFLDDNFDAEIEVVG